jgi:hypothetical protein
MRASNWCAEQGHTCYIGASAMKAVDFVQLQYVPENLETWLAQVH